MVFLWLTFFLINERIVSFQVKECLCIQAFMNCLKVVVLEDMSKESYQKLTFGLGILEWSRKT